MKWFYSPILITKDSIISNILLIIYKYMMHYYITYSLILQIKELANHFQIIAPDTRAHGRTTCFLYLIFPHQIGESLYLNT